MAIAFLRVFHLFAFGLAAERTQVEAELTQVFTIGDLHGDAACARYWVSRSGLVRGLERPPSEWAWADHAAKLVFMGDYVDKGPEARDVLLFVKALTDRFPDHVVALMGNHELNLLSDRSRTSGLAAGSDGGYRYLELAWGAAHPGQYAQWLPPDELRSADHQRALGAIFTALGHVYHANQHASVLVAADGAADPPRTRSLLRWIADADTRELVARALQRWQAAYLAGVASGSELGDWLERRPLTAVLADTLFVHAGVPAALVGARGPFNSRDALARLNAELAAHANEGALDAFLARRADAHELVEFRGLHKDCSQVQAVAQALNVIRIAVGHTPADAVRVLCGGALLALDSALGRWFRTAGNSYCQGDVDQLSSRGEIACPKKAARCEGQVARLVRGPADGGEPAFGGWVVQLVESDDDGSQAARWSTLSHGGGAEPAGGADEL